MADNIEARGQEEFIIKPGIIFNYFITKKKLIISQSKAIFMFLFRKINIKNVCKERMPSIYFIILLNLKSILHLVEEKNMNVKKN